MHSTKPLHFNLVSAAHAAMIEHGFQPDFPAGTDTAKDLDQIEWAEKLPDGRIRVLIGVADVDVRVAKDTLLDTHARSETTSVYAGVKVFPMLPAELSEGITSLNEDQDRVALVIEYTVDQAGSTADGKAYRALVRNQ